MTAINRRVFMAGKFIFLAQLVLAVGVWSMDLPVSLTLTMNLFMWGALCGMFAVHTDPWLGVTSAGYFIAFLFATRFPESRMWVVSAANLCLSLTVIIRWRPTARIVSEHSVYSVRSVREDKP